MSYMGEREKEIERDGDRERQRERGGQTDREGILSYFNTSPGTPPLHLLSENTKDTPKRVIV